MFFDLDRPPGITEHWSSEQLGTLTSLRSYAIPLRPLKRLHLDFASLALFICLARFTYTATYNAVKSTPIVVATEAAD